MCGVVGIIANSEVNQIIFDALTALQHRGQDAAGAITCKEGHLALRKGKGLVRDVFHTRHMLRLKGNMGVGHVRYPTAGTDTEAEAQPFYVNSPYGIALAHNGNLTNAVYLKQELFNTDLRHLNTNSDSEILLNVLAHELQKQKKLAPEPADFFKAVAGVHQRVRGGYAVVSMIANFGILAFRDPHGIRPLIFGKRTTEKGVEYIVASESVAITSLDFEVIRDVAPSEAVFINLKGEVHTFNFNQQQEALHTPCIFEYVYFARPDSVIDKISVYKFRLNVGKRLGLKIQKEWQNLPIDVIIPIPETSRGAALSLATQLNIKFREGFVKNRYIGRTFIMPGQAVRKRSVRQKLNAIDLEFKGKNVLLIDDSIVRGTTSKEIIQMARDAGANKVYFASCAPPIKFPNIYGIDMPTKEELIAHNLSIPEIKKAIGADELIYLELEDLYVSAREGNADIIKFEAAVFDGDYITGDESEYLTQVAKARKDSARFKPNHVSENQIDLHNDDLLD